MKILCIIKNFIYSNTDAGTKVINFRAFTVFITGIVLLRMKVFFSAVFSKHSLNWGASLIGWTFYDVVAFKMCMLMYEV